MKILMALMGLDIGGAETHVVELSKALQKQGHQITVASNGGVYCKELEECGIQHVHVPLHSKKPWHFIKSYVGLKRLFDSNEYDIVHAHARIPAYICGILAKKYSFRFVTTAHWVFKITPLWKKLANWGEKTIAVSDDIKEYLIENYDVWSDNISTTINGIDTNKFSKQTDWSSIKEEFDLQDDKYRILYVSRMDTDRSAVAFMTAEAMPEILKIRPNAELLIVGDGNDFERLKAHTDAINDKIGHKAIKLAGARVDINKFVAASDVFIGVSRSALEAMASGIPVIIAGNEGFIGVFDESKFQISYETNYCCRGCEESSTELVLQSFKQIFSMTNDELEQLSAYNKETIRKYYSADRMAKDYVDMYESLTPISHYKHGDIIVNGYYGFKNTGDEALLQAMIENIKSIDKNAKITVLSSTPKETAARYSVNSIHRYNLFKITREMKHASLFISGGGSLLQDVTSTKSLIYYTKIIELAKKYGLKIMIYANGFGPICKEKNLKRVRRALSYADHISMREPASAEAVNNAFPEIKVTVTADPAFSLKGVDGSWSSKLYSKYGLDDNTKYFGVSLRDWQDNDPKIINKISDYCKAVYTKFNYVPVFITMQNSKDATICKEVSSTLDIPSVTISKTTAKELISIMSRMEYNIGMRLHFLVFSTICKVPALGISYDPKINSLMNYIGLGDPINSKSIDVNVLMETTNNIVSNRSDISESLSNKLEEMIAHNKTDAQKTIQLLNNQ